MATQVSLKKKKGDEPVNYLREKVYPDLYKALVQLIDHIIKTDEIRKHQERLKKKKVFDKLEQKKVEKDRLKAELGSEYESSEGDSLDFEELGLDKEEFEQIKHQMKEEREEGEEQRESQRKDSNDDKIQQQEKPNAEEEKKHALSQNLGQIAEDEGERDDKEDNVKLIEAEKEKMKAYLKQQRDTQAFNPLKFLAEQLKKIHDK